MPWIAMVIPMVAKVIEPLILSKAPSGILGDLYGLAFAPDLYLKRKLGIEPTPGDGKGGDDAFKSQSQALTHTIRSSVEPRRIIYGEARVGGPLVFADVTPRTSVHSTKLYLHMIVPLATHEIEAVGWGASNVPGVIFIDSYAWFNGGDARYKLLADSSSDTAGTTNAGPLFIINPHLGAEDQAADATLMAQDPVWSSAHRLRGVAYLYVSLREDPGVWTTGIPNVSAIVRGKKLYDPRVSTIAITTSSVANPGVFTTGSVHGLAVGDHIFIDGHSGSVPAVAKELHVATVPTTTTFTLLGNDGSGSIGETLALTTGGSGGTLSKIVWSDNAALCILDYLLAPFGFNCDMSEIDTAAFIAAANVCDEMVALTETSDTFTADAATDNLARPQLTNPIKRGDGVWVSSTGTLPTGLSASTTYYYIPSSPTISNTAPNAGQPIGFNGFLATTLANARAGVKINFTTDGTGTLTLTRKSQPRYVVNGVCVLDDTPIAILQRLLTACAGLPTYTQGEFRILAAASVASTVTVDEDELRDDLILRSKTERNNLFNTVRGSFVDPVNQYQLTEYPQITSVALKLQDGGEEITRDLDLPFENDITRCQRLAKIALLRARTGGQSINFPAKLSALRLAPQDTVSVSVAQLGLSAATFLIGGMKFNESFGIDLELSRVSSADYAWTAAEAATPTSPATLSLIDSSYAASPGLSLSEDTIVTSSGSTVTRLIVTLTPPSGTVVDHYEVEVKLSTASVYTQLGVGTQTVYTVLGVIVGSTYDVRARTIAATGAISAYATGSRTIDGPPPAGGTMWDSIPGNIDSWVPSIDAM